MDAPYLLLNDFVGKWNTTGTLMNDDGLTDAKIEGTDLYEWLPGQFFLQHTVDVHVGPERVQTLEIIGWDPEREVYTMQHFDSKGNSGSMTAICSDGQWRFTGERLRFTGQFEPDRRTISGTWEKLQNDDTWLPFMEVRLRKDV
ncbi:MAG: DUF1579 domain-containing protein [Chitinophagaceae bacterium]|nr:MAG: DUF1579 domain-containing protein [Chitinophagaceae bacterium]